MNPDVTAFHKKPLLARLSTQPLKPGCCRCLNTLRQHFCGLVFRNKNLGSHFCWRKYDTFPFLLPFLFASVRSHTHTMNTLVPSGAQPDTFPSGPGPPLASRLSPPPGSFSDFLLLAFSSLGFAPSLFPLQPHPPPLLALLLSPLPPRTPPRGQHHGRHQSTCTDQISSFQPHNNPQNRPAGALRAGMLAWTSL